MGEMGSRAGFSGLDGCCLKGNVLDCAGATWIGEGRPRVAAVAATCCWIDNGAGTASADESPMGLGGSTFRDKGSDVRIGEGDVTFGETLTGSGFEAGFSGCEGSLESWGA